MIEKQQNYVTGEQKPNMMSSIEAFKFKRRRQICPLLFTGIHRTNFRYITRAVATSEATEVYKLLFFTFYVSYQHSSILLNLQNTEKLANMRSPFDTQMLKRLSFTGCP